MNTQKKDEKQVLCDACGARFRKKDDEFCPSCLKERYGPVFPPSLFVIVAAVTMGVLFLLIIIYTLIGDRLHFIIDMV